MSNEKLPNSIFQSETIEHPQCGNFTDGGLAAIARRLDQWLEARGQLPIEEYRRAQQFGKGKKLRTKQSDRECIIEGCTNKGYRRQVCHTCYSRVRRAVANKTMTWESAEEQGLLGKKK